MKEQEKDPGVEENGQKKAFFVIPGDPVPLARPRCGNGRFYDSQKNLKVCAGIYLDQQYKNNELFTGPVILTVNFYMYLPRRRAKTDTRKKNSPHYFRPDLSNLLKFCEDLITDVTTIWKDDCIIAEVHCKKLYSSNPRTELTIERYYEQNPPK